MKKKILFIFVLVMFFGFSNLVLADTNINLSIQTNAGAIFEEEISVSPCDSDNNPDTPDIETPYCAILQTGLNNDWSWWGDDAFLNLIDGIENNSGDNGIYWGYFINLELGSIALNKYSLNNGDNILLTYGVDPLKISVNDENPEVGNIIEITATFFGYNESWNPVWTPLADGVINIGNESFQLQNGIFEYQIQNSDSFNVQVLNNNYISSNVLQIRPEKNTKSYSSSSSGYLVYKIKKTVAPFNLQKAIDFVLERQKENGSWGDDLYTDWVAIALSKVEGIDNSKLKEFLLQNELEEPLLTDYERRAMALMAFDINPYFGTSVNYIQKIVEAYDGEQFGNIEFLNDDVFALLVLSNAGYSYEDEIIKNTISLLLLEQNKNGSLGDVDMTSAFVQSLGKFKDVKEINEAILKAQKYLNSKQKLSGGFGNIFSSAWVLQVVEDYSVREKIKEYFAKEQKFDGGVLEIKENDNNRIWATVYTIPAFLELSWNDILSDFSKVKSVVLELSFSFNNDGTVEVEKKYVQIEEEEEVVDSNLNFGKEYQLESIQTNGEIPEDKNPYTKFILLGALILGIITFFIILK